MELIFDAKTFKPLSGFLAGLIPREENIPGESLIRIFGDAGHAVFVAGTNYEAGRLSCELISGEGKYAVQSKRFIPLVSDWDGQVKLLDEADLLGKSKATVVSLEQDGEQATKVRFLKTDDKTEVTPTIATPMPALHIEASWLADSLRRAQEATGEFGNMSYSSGILLELKGSLLKAAATDGKLLFLRQKDVYNKDNKGKLNSVLPIDSLKHLLRFLNLPNDEKEVQIFDTESFLIVRRGDDWLSVRTLEAKYPDCDKILQNVGEHCASITLPTADVEVFMKRAKLVYENKRYTRPAVQIIANAGNLRIKAASVNIGEYEEGYKLEKAQDGDGSVLVDADLVRRMLKACGGQSIRIDMPKEVQPLKLANPDDDSLIGLLMVMSDDTVAQ